MAPLRREGLGSSRKTYRQGWHYCGVQGKTRIIYPIPCSLGSCNYGRAKTRSHARCFKIFKIFKLIEQGPHRRDLPENCTCCRSDIPPDVFMASFTPFAFCCLACLAGLSDSLHVLGWCKLWPLQVCNPQVVEITWNNPQSSNTGLMQKTWRFTNKFL